MPDLSHVDAEGRVRMVDVGHKKPQRRTARAAGHIALSERALALVAGDLTVAQIAGIAAAKRTAGLIPLCHLLPLDRIEVRLHVAVGGVEAESEVACVGRTGVEMEALTAVSVALLAIYDMCKAVDKGMRIEDVRLVEKVKRDVEED